MPDPAPRGSICMPAFNAEAYVVAAIDSALAQTYHDIEIVVVNDGSRDGTRDVRARYGERITIVDQDSRGQCAAANQAFLQSSSSLILLSFAVA